LQTCSNCKSVVSSQSEHCPACGQHLFVAAPVESLRLLAAAAVPHRFRRIFVVLLVAAGAAVFYRGVIVRETKAVRPVEVAVPSPVIAAVPELVDSGADTNIHAGLPTVRPSSRPTTYVLEPLLTAVSPLKIIPHRFIISEEDLGVVLDRQFGKNNRDLRKFRACSFDKQSGMVQVVIALDDGLPTCIEYIAMEDARHILGIMRECKLPWSQLEIMGTLAVKQSMGYKKIETRVFDCTWTRQKTDGLNLDDTSGEQLFRLGSNAFLAPALKN